ncbi:hypothetical protein C8F01DRAFT_1339380 [Mycena amicta]|nr:hypothetical protein C8F01DRAFT_1339380 [Mycena amicta]
MIPPPTLHARLALEGNELVETLGWEEVKNEVAVRKAFPEQDHFSPRSNNARPASTLYRLRPSDISPLQSSAVPLSTVEFDSSAVSTRLSVDATAVAVTTQYPYRWPSTNLVSPGMQTHTLPTDFSSNTRTQTQLSGLVSKGGRDEMRIKIKGRSVVPVASASTFEGLPSSQIPSTLGAAPSVSWPNPPRALVIPLEHSHWIPRRFMDRTTQVGGHDLRWRYRHFRRDSGVGRRNSADHRPPNDLV